MRALVIGAGSAGSILAAKLCEEQHDVVVVDHRAQPLAELEQRADILAVQGHGSSPAVLRKAKADAADLLVAVTSDDEVNLLACAVGRAAGVKYRVARIANEDYLAADAKPPPSAFGVDLAINPKKECARELASLLRLPGTQEVVELLEGRAMAVGFRVSSECPLLRAPLKAYPEPELLTRIRFIALQRGPERSIPSGETRFQVGDSVYAVGEPASIPDFLRVVCPDRPDLRKVVIAGGGGMGLTLAKFLEQDGPQVVMIERDEAQADQAASVLGKALVIRGDIMEAETLAQAQFNAQTAFVAATGDDENNIISCLLAQKQGVAFTIAKVSKPEYVPVIDSLSLLDRAVNPHLSMMRAILHFVRGRNVRSASLLHTLPGELLEVHLSGRSRWAGRRVRDLRVPRGAIIAAVQRGEAMAIPTGDVELKSEDRLLLFALPDTIRRLESLFHR